MRGSLVMALPLALAACATSPTLPPAQDAWFTALSSLCGHAYEGSVREAPAGDTTFAGKVLVMHVRACRDDEVRIPFHVGEDRSRTWILTRTPTGIRLKHDHRHADGSPDELTMYGGDTAAPGTAGRQEFPVDAESIALFTRTDRSVSNTNVWAMEAGPSVFAYELRRPPFPGGRFLRVEFDLTRPVSPPPPPWGAS